MHAHTHTYAPTPTHTHTHTPTRVHSCAGEPFTEDEVTEMFRTAVDINDNKLYYEDHAMILALDDEVYPYHD